jgi:PERQ amino acid-rich with GYF domain-containing protein
MKLFNVQDRQSEIGSSPNKGSRGGKQPAHPTPNSGPQDDFTRWCFEKVQAIGGSVDIPTFVAFLKEVESPYEVGDYVRSYLGDGKEAREFSRDFLERRSRWKNARKDGGGSLEDNLCRPASAVNPNSNDFQEVKAKGKKPKKGKMQKVDSRILGFSTSAATDRLNVGNRDYGDSPE